MRLLLRANVIVGGASKNAIDVTAQDKLKDINNYRSKAGIFFAGGEDNSAGRITAHATSG